MSDYSASVVRTGTPIVVGWLLASAIGPYLDPDLAREAVAALIGFVYYGIVRFLEVRLGKQWAGWLLGIAVQPIYVLDTDIAAHSTKASRAK